MWNTTFKFANNFAQYVQNIRNHNMKRICVLDIKTFQSLLKFLYVDKAL